MLYRRGGTKKADASRPETRRLRFINNKDVPMRIGNIFQLVKLSAKII